MSAVILGVEYVWSEGRDKLPKRAIPLDADEPEHAVIIEARRQEAIEQTVAMAVGMASASKVIRMDRSPIDMERVIAIVDSQGVLPFAELRTRLARTHRDKSLAYVRKVVERAEAEGRLRVQGDLVVSLSLDNDQEAAE